MGVLVAVFEVEPEPERVVADDYARHHVPFVAALAFRPDQLLAMFVNVPSLSFVAQHRVHGTHA